MEVMFQSKTPWKQISIKECDKTWLAKFEKNSEGYQIGLTNINETYYKALNKKEIEEKNGEVNPRLKTSVESIVEHLVSSLNDAETVFEFDEKIVNKSFSKVLSFSNKFSKVFPFKWKFEFPANKNILLCPLILTVNHLLSENEKLKKIIQTKCPESLDVKQEEAKFADPKEEPTAEGCKLTIDKESMQKFCLETLCTSGFTNKISDALNNFQNNKLNPNVSSQLSSQNSLAYIRKINYEKPEKRKLLDEDSQSELVPTSSDSEGLQLEKKKLDYKLSNSPKKSKLFQKKKRRKHLLL